VHQKHPELGLVHTYHDLQSRGLAVSALFLKFIKFFPNLVHDLTYGSPTGNPPSVSENFLPPNLSSANIHLDLIEQELLSEVAASCMSGPFTLTQFLAAPFAPHLLDWCKKSLVMESGK